ncbi:MAG: hypothetical protein CL893_04355 [Dehalococcoidia bacterium]|nr:hypothetical protein [Dehalococcoidia bacterium]
MCTMISEKADVKGSGKKTTNWIPLDSCDIYYDHSTYVDCEHSITLSFKNEMNPIDSRITVEITPESAKDIINKINAALEKGNHIS